MILDGFLGWVMAMNTAHDERGVMHLLRETGRPACGTRCPLAGQIEAPPSDHAPGMLH